MSNPESKQYNTIFMGPLTHRETRLDSYLNAKKEVKWSEEAENEYMENVKARASEKVRALLLQAKRRSDEIIREAEQKAQEITAQAEQNGHVIEQNAQNVLTQAEQRYQDTYQEAVQKAHEEIQQILIQNQQALGESTAIVLLSIHEQIAKFYETWKEDLKQLTIDAIEVGTGWVATTEKEAILKQLLDESVQKLIDKKNFIVRVNPADAELITQVLENSREKGWSMESSKELEPGSLELESDNVYVKNSRSERQKFVQEILDNLVLPQNSDDEHILQNVKNTLDHEMQHNPVLAHAVNQETPQAPLNIIPLENIMPTTIDTVATSINKTAMSEQNTEIPQDINFSNPIKVSDINSSTAIHSTESIPTPAQEISTDMFDTMPEQISPDMFDGITAPPMQEQTDFLSNSDKMQKLSEQHETIAEETQTINSNTAQHNGFTSDDMFETLQTQQAQEAEQIPYQDISTQQNTQQAPYEIQQKSQPTSQPLPTVPHELTEIIEELPSFDHPHKEISNPQDQIHAEVNDMVEEFLGTPKKDETALPNNVADDLLAEMGFNQK